MEFLKNVKTVYVVGNDHKLNEKIVLMIKKFIGFWNFKIRIEIRTDYFDILLEEIHGSNLFITTESGLGEMTNSNVFSVLRRRFMNSKILHLHDKFTPNQLEKSERKCVDNFVSFKGDFTLEFNRAFLRLNS